VFILVDMCVCCLCVLSSRAARRDGLVFMLVGNRSEGLELDQRVFQTGLKIGLKPLICVNETQWDLRYIVGRLLKL